MNRTIVGGLAVLGGVSAFVAFVAGCAGRTTSGNGTSAEMQPVAVDDVSGPVVACAAGYAHPNVCCEASAGQPSACGNYPGAPFQGCAPGATTYPDPRACCPLDGQGDCVAPPSAPASPPGSCSYACPPGAYQPDGAPAGTCCEVDASGATACWGSAVAVSVGTGNTGAGSASAGSASAGSASAGSSGAGSAGSSSGTANGSGSGTSQTGCAEPGTTCSCPVCTAGEPCPPCECDAAPPPSTCPTPTPDPAPAPSPPPCESSGCACAACPPGESCPPCDCPPSPPCPVSPTPSCGACPAGWQVPEGAPYLCCTQDAGGAIECFSQAIPPSPAPQPLPQQTGG